MQDVEDSVPSGATATMSPVYQGELMQGLRTLGLIVSTALAACASGPSKEDIARELAGFELPTKPKPNEALLYVVRPSEQARMFRLDLYVEGPEAYRPKAITSGVYYAAIPVEPGLRKVCASVYRPANFDGSACRPIQLKIGEIGFLEIELIPERQGWSYYLSAIDEEDGRLKVKRIQDAHRSK